MQHRVFGSADVKIDAWRGFGLCAHPVALGLFAAKTAAVDGVKVTQVIPAASGPLGHGVRFARRAAGQLNPFFGASQRRFACGCGFEIS